MPKDRSSQTGAADPTAESAPRGRKHYFAALISAQLAALARIAIVARIIGPEQMGLAAILVLTAQFFDSVTDTGSDRFVIQDRHGAEAETRGGVHLLALIKGAFVAGLMLIFGGLIADLAGAPRAAEGIRVLALVPLINGFVNYDFRLAQRSHNFAPEARIMMASEVAGLVTTSIAAFIIRDFTAVLYGLCARALVATLVSHLVSIRPYRPVYSKAVAKRLFNFGGPLMLNGFFIFLATQSDRVIISRLVGLESLGRYSVALLLCLYPSLTLMRFIASLTLPQIAQHRDHEREAGKVVDRFFIVTSLLATTVAIGFSAIGSPVITLFFGKRFAVSGAVVTLIGLIICWRMIAYVPNTLALALGRTKTVLAMQFVRLVGIPAAFAGFYVIGGLAGVATGLIVGELLSNLTALAILRRGKSWSQQHWGIRMSIPVAASVALGLETFARLRGQDNLAWACTAAALAILLIGLWNGRSTLLALAALRPNWLLPGLSSRRGSEARGWKW